MVTMKTSRTIGWMALAFIKIFRRNIIGIKMKYLLTILLVFGFLACSTTSDLQIYEAPGESIQKPLRLLAVHTQ
jgi:hypothetical protein